MPLMAAEHQIGAGQHDLGALVASHDIKRCRDRSRHRAPALALSLIDSRPFPAARCRAKAGEHYRVSHARQRPCGEQSRPSLSGPHHFAQHGKGRFLRRIRARRRRRPAAPPPARADRGRSPARTFPPTSAPRSMVVPSITSGGSGASGSIATSLARLPPAVPAASRPARSAPRTPRRCAAAPAPG